MIKIGFSQCDFFLEKNYPSNLAIGNGILIFNGYANMGAGCKMSLNMGGGITNWQSNVEYWTYFDNRS